MKIGVVLPTRNVVTGSQDAATELESLVSVAVHVDEIGVDSVWVGDSLLGRPRPEPIAMLAAIGSRTRNITIGTSALLPAMRHPLQLAQQIATVDLICKGRLIIGVGSGFPNDQTRQELDALQIDYGSRIARCHECVAWCRSFWGADAPPGRVWELRSYTMQPMPAQMGGPPFWLGGATLRTFETVGASYDGWMPTSPSAQAFADGWAIVEQSARKAGRDPKRIARASVLTLVIDDDSALAHDRLARFMETYYSVPLSHASTVIGCSSGSLDEVVQEIESFQQAGVQHLLIRFASADQLGEIRKWSRPLLEALRTQA